ncbi:fungal trichothecene efflux pump [Xylariaceae sp. FL1272]|nr:fungal trichothecene efflux pump [Xylariaceae sp. FL1272]
MAAHKAVEPSPGVSDHSDIEKTGRTAHYEHAEVMTPLGVEDGKLTKETILAFIALCGQINAYIMTLLIPSTTLPYIIADLGPDPNYPWITITWTLGAAIIVSIGGRLSDIFGRRYFMITGALISIVGTIVGATGQSINQMIASGVLFGLGSGFQELCYACVQEVVPNHWRVRAVGLLDLSNLIAFSSPVISYVFIAFQPIGWRGAYWYMFSFHVFAFVLLFFFYNPPDFEMKHRDEGVSRLRLLAQIDWVGVFLFAAAAVLFLLGLNFGGRTYPWKHPGTLVPLIVGLLLFVASGFWAAYNNLKYPLFPRKLFRKVREFDMVIVVCFVGGTLYYSMNVLWPKQSQVLFIGSNDVILRGVYAVIFSTGTWLAAVITVFICSRLHHEKWQLIGFTIVQTALIASMASVGIDDKAQAIAIVVLAATSITPPQLLSFTMLSFGIQDQEDMGIACGLGSTFRLLGGSIATALYTAIYTNKFNEELPGEMRNAIAESGVAYSDSLLASLIKAGTTNTVAAYSAVQGATPELITLAEKATKLAYVKGFSLVYLISIAFGVAAIGAAACTVSVDRSKKNNARAVVLKNEIHENESLDSKVVQSI